MKIVKKDCYSNFWEKGKDKKINDGQEKILTMIYIFMISVIFYIMNYIFSKKINYKDY